MDLLSLQPITDKRDHIYEHGCQATRSEGEIDREREREFEKERKLVTEKKIAMLLPREEEKSEQYGLIAFHR